MNKKIFQNSLDDSAQNFIERDEGEPLTDYDICEWYWKNFVYKPEKRGTSRRNRAKKKWATCKKEVRWHE